MKKTILIHRRREIFVLRRTGKENFRRVCPDCVAEVEMLTLDSAVSFSGIGGREIIRRIELGEIHSIEAASGQLLVCEKSLREKKR